ncbi:MAG: AraC family transcriptional regulator [Verrucomicrobiota bacterium]
MDNLRMKSSLPEQDQTLVSLFHTPTEAGREVFYCVLRAGHFIAGQAYRKVPANFAGHKILLCLKGKGYVLINGRTWPVAKGQMLWIFNRHANEHWPEKGSHWEMYWIRVEGPRMDRIYKILTAAGSPVFTGVNAPETAAIFERIFRIMNRASPTMEAEVHVQVAALIAQLFKARRYAYPAAAMTKNIPLSLEKVVEAMRLEFSRPWRAGELAALANMSTSSFYRHFAAVLGSSPIDWLRRERISQAKRLLIETDYSISEVADHVGYHDQFYFSRDFKQMTQMSPSKYRQRERA